MSIARYFRPDLRPGLLRGEMPAWLAKHPRKDYIIRFIVHTPDWTDREELAKLRKEAHFKTVQLGILHVMDHIIPLSHPYVSGLNVSWNIQILTWKQNAIKSNNWMPDQQELF